jgi:hypothetical protein
MKKRIVFGLAAAVLAALMIAAPADAQTARKTAGKEIALEIYGMETPTDVFGIFSVRQNGAEKTSMEHPSKLMQGGNVCLFQNIREG